MLLPSVLGFIFFLFLIPSSVFADNLLLNSSFEDITNGSPGSWTKSPSTAILSTSTTSKTGTASATINKTNSSTGSIYLYQDVDVEPDAFYSLSGYAVKNSSNFSWVILRISWRNSSTEISKSDSSQLTLDSSDFQELKIDSAQAPSQAIKARIELVANIVTVNPSNPALFDDINFSQVPIPDQPTPTPIPLPTNTPVPNTPVPSKTPTPAPTATKTPTPSPTKAPTKITPTKVDAKENKPTAILGASTIEEKPTPTPTAKPEETTNYIPLVLIGMGIVFLAGFAILSYPQLQFWKKQ